MEITVQSHPLKRISGIEITYFAETGKVCLILLEICSPDGASREKEVEKDKVAIPRHMGFFGCVWHMVGMVIGNGIFITPAGVLLGSGGSVGVALIMWVACGIVQTCGALVYTEMALMFKKSGGEMTFLYESWGPIVAFLKLWIVIFVLSAGSAIGPSVIAQYLLTPFFQQCPDGVPTIVIRLLGISIFFCVIVLNCVSVKWPSRFAGFCTIAKSFGLMVIITTGIYNLTQGHTTYLQNAFNSGNPEVKLLPIAFFSGNFAYSGWDIVASLTEEIKNPERNIPRSAVFSMTFIMVIYVMTNVAYFTLLSPQQVLTSKAVAADYSILALGQYAWLIWLFVALSALGGLNSGIFRLGRQLFAIAREGLLPEIFSMLNVRYCTPIPAVLIPTIGLVYLIEPDIISIIRYAAFIELIFDTMTVAVLPYYRWKHPDLERPFRVPWIFVIVYLSAQIFIMCMSFYLDPIRKSIGIAVILLGIPVYFAFLHPKHRLKNEWIKSVSVNVTRFLQKVFRCVHEEREKLK